MAAVSFSGGGAQVNVFNGANLSLYCEVAYALGSDKPPRPLESPAIPRTPRLPRGVRRGVEGRSSPVRCRS